jgi:hypothetical protein
LWQFGDENGDSAEVATQLRFPSFVEENGDTGALLLLLLLLLLLTPALPLFPGWKTSAVAVSVVDSPLKACLPDESNAGIATKIWWLSLWEGIS